MNLDVIAMKLQVDGLGRIGESIFIGDMPASATTGIILRGAYLGTPIDYELPGREETHFHVAIRGETYSKGKALADKVSKSLNICETEMTGMYVTYIRPKIRPIAFPISDATIFEFLVIFEAIYVIVE